MVIVRSDRGHRPERLLLAACSNCLGISRISPDPRAPGRPWATAGATVESHVARLGKFAPPMCSVHSRLGEGIPATRAARCSAVDSRRTASAGSGCIGSILRAPSCAIDQHRSEPSLEPILPRATRRGCFCGMLVAATTDPRRAALVLLPSLADSDPKARSALHTRKGVRSTVHIKPRPNRRHCAVCPSV